MIATRKLSNATSQTSNSNLFILTYEFRYSNNEKFDLKFSISDSPEFSKAFYEERRITIDQEELPLLTDALRLISLLKTKIVPEIELNEALSEIRDMQIKINDLEDDILPKKNARIKELLMKYDKLETKFKEVEKLLQNAQYEISTKETLVKNLLVRID